MQTSKWFWQNALTTMRTMNKCCRTQSNCKVCEGVSVCVKFLKYHDILLIATIQPFTASNHWTSTTPHRPDSIVWQNPGSSFRRISATSSKLSHSILSRHIHTFNSQHLTPHHVSKPIPVPTTITNEYITTTALLAICIETLNTRACNINQSGTRILSHYRHGLIWNREIYEL